MAKKQTGETTGKVGIKPSSPERKLLLEVPISIHERLAYPISKTATTSPVLLTLDDWEEVAGYVAAEGNHATDKKLRKKLAAIFAKIQDVLETFRVEYVRSRKRK